MRVSLEIDAHGRVPLSVPTYNAELSVQVNLAPPSTALEE
jgi:hypothetical protein